MGVTREELANAGATPELARLLARELRQGPRNDLTRHPMAVACLIAFFGIVGWLALGMTSLQNDVIRLEEGQVRLEEGQARLEEGLMELEEGQARLEEKIDGLAKELREVLRR